MRTHHWRQRYWARSQVGYPEFMRAAPNKAHQALVQWENSGRLVGVITQNVDRLHQKAGQQRVIDLHGRLDRVICTRCQRTLARASVQDFLDLHNPDNLSGAFTPAPDGDADLARLDFSRFKVPNCADCGGILKPDVVFFGDSVPKTVVAQAYAWVSQADALLVVGSSLMVYSSFRFVRRAHERGIPIVAVNRGKTRADDLLTDKIVDDCETALQTLTALNFSPH